MNNLSKKDQESLVDQIAEGNQPQNIYQVFSECYKLSGEAKKEGAMTYISDLMENCEMKFIVFAHHLDMLNAIEEYAKKKKH